MTYQTLPTKAGVDKDNSPLTDQLTWTDADKIRFVGGLPETIYGWEQAAGTPLTGICRGAFTYADNARNPIAAFGTHLRLYAMDLDGTLADITPVAERGVFTNPFSTTSGSAVVTVADTNHGRVAQDKVTFAGAAAVGRGGGIRTRDIQLPKLALYQAELRPEASSRSRFLRVNGPNRKGRYSGSAFTSGFSAISRPVAVMGQVTRSSVAPSAFSAHRHISPSGGNPAGIR